MIYFSLPNLYHHDALMIKICQLQKQQSEVFKIPVQFISITEPTPFCYLCGGINNNTNRILTYADLQKTTQAQISYLSKRLNFSNIHLNENDANDEYFNILLQAYNNNYSNVIEISNIPIAVKLKEKNILYDLIFSANADVLFPFNEDNLNTIIEQNIFKLISLPNYTTNLDFSKINNRKVLELTVNNICQNCPTQCQKECINNEHLSIYNYSNISYFMKCQQHMPYNEPKTINISLEDIQKTYLPLGIKHYKLSEFPNAPLAFIDFITFFVDYFIKEEYKSKILLQLIKENEIHD